MSETVAVEVYDVTELTGHARERAFNWLRSAEDRQFISDEINGSLAAVYKAAGFNTRTRSVGDVGGKSGRRAWAWLENCLLGPRRFDYRAPKLRKDHMKYGERYLPDQVRPCPFTGVCYDDDLLDDLCDSIRYGMTVDDSLRWLEEKAERIYQDEMEWRHAEDQLIEMAQANEYKFTSDGHYFRG